MRRFLSRLCAALLIAIAGFTFAQSLTRQDRPNLALLGGNWFNGSSFEAKNVYTVEGRFTLTKPARVDRTLDLARTWIVPPFAEAHNHNIGTGSYERDGRAIQKYLDDGVFYVKIQGNLPLRQDQKLHLGINLPASVDAVFAQGSLTAEGGHPISLAESLLHFGYFPGYSAESLRDYRYFIIDSDADFEEKWPLILALRPDFIKTFLWSSEEFDYRRGKPEFFGQRGLSPRVLRTIVAKAHTMKLRVSTHVTTANDFHNALEAGVDEIAHIPFLPPALIAEDDASLAANMGVTVITTLSMVPNLPRAIVPLATLPGILKTQEINLRLLRDKGVRIAIGSDNVADSSASEFQYVSRLGILDNLSLIRIWTLNTPRAIFPDRKIGELREGFEASFLALEGNPIHELQNLRRYKLRVKQGFVLDNRPTQ